MLVHVFDILARFEVKWTWNIQSVRTQTNTKYI